MSSSAFHAAVLPTRPCEQATSLRVRHIPVWPFLMAPLGFSLLSYVFVSS
jgi:hypothetical protein